MAAPRSIHQFSGDALLARRRMRRLQTEDYLSRNSERIRQIAASGDFGQQQTRVSHTEIGAPAERTTTYLQWPPGWKLQDAIDWEDSFLFGFEHMPPAVIGDRDVFVRNMGFQWLQKKMQDIVEQLHRMIAEGNYDDNMRMVAESTLDDLAQMMEESEGLYATVEENWAAIDEVLPDELWSKETWETDGQRIGELKAMAGAMHDRFYEPPDERHTNP